VNDEKIENLPPADPPYVDDQPDEGVPSGGKDPEKAPKAPRDGGKVPAPGELPKRQ